MLAGGRENQRFAAWNDWDASVPTSMVSGTGTCTGKAGGTWRLDAPSPPEGEEVARSSRRSLTESTEERAGGKWRGERRERSILRVFLLSVSSCLLALLHSP